MTKPISLPVVSLAPQENYLTVGEAARRLRCSKRMVMSCRRAWRLRTIKRDGELLVSEASVEEAEARLAVIEGGRQ